MFRFKKSTLLPRRDPWRDPADYLKIMRKLRGGSDVPNEINCNRCPPCKVNRMCCDHAALRCVPCNEARQHVEEVDVARGRPMTFIWPKPRLCALCLEASSIGRSLEASSRPRIAVKCMHSFRRLLSFPRNLGTKTSADWGRGVESRPKRPSLGKRSGRGVRVPPTVRVRSLPCQKR